MLPANPIDSNHRMPEYLSDIAARAYYMGQGNSRRSHRGWYASIDSSLETALRRRLRERCSDKEVGHLILYILRCSSDKSLYGVTDDVLGAKLARTACPGGTWISYKQLDPSTFSTKTAERHIKLQGYYVFRVESRGG